MSKDRNFERRMIVSKYSNRPPFDLKKSKEAYDILDKIREYPVEVCRNCCRNMGKCSKNTLTKPAKSLATEASNKTSNTPGKRVIPKVIETFQKLNISQEEEGLPTSKKASIQTLYRNQRSCKLGKNIPKHKLMKSLLQNLDSEVDSCKKVSPRLSFPTKGRFKNKKSAIISKKQSLDRNEAVCTVSCEKTTEESCNMVSRPVKIDKRTSTTGLIWPPGSKEVLQYSNVLHRHQMNRNCFQKLLGNQQGQGTTSCSTIREECQKNPVPQIVSNGFLKDLPTKGVPQNVYVEPTRSEKVLRKNIVSIEQLRQKSLEDSAIRKSQRKETNVRPQNIEKKHQDQLKNSSLQKLKSREKSFVQSQVEKLNKVMRIPKSPGPKLSKPQNFNGGVQKRNEGAHGDYLRRDEVTSKHMGLMDRIRNNLPRIQKSDNYESFGSGDNDWSDTGSDLSPEHIRFPKETRTAVDQRLSEKKGRIPLSKFTKLHNNFRPAIPPRGEEFDNAHYGYGEGIPNRNRQNGYNGPSPPERPKQRRNKNLRKTGNAPVKSSISVPCKKNLLCDKGEQHLGTCGFTHNRNKVVY